MDRLPIEITLHILSISLDVHPIPSNLLRVNKTWNESLAPILHSHIRLESLSQLYLFGKVARLCRIPKTFALYLPGGAVHFTGRSHNQEQPDTPKDQESAKAKVFDNGGVWGCLRYALLKCPTTPHVTLRLHSFVSDPYLTLLTTALGGINPRQFQWTGPDPDHHLSSAIVPRATEYLFKAIKSWTNLQRLTLRNIQFPSPPATSVFTSAFTFQTHSLLREIFIGQAVFLPPGSVTTLVMAVPSLETLTLEDVYVSSIWGPRVRVDDVMSELNYLSDEDERKVRLREIVKCTVRLERIVGGDRG